MDGTWFTSRDEHSYEKPGLAQLTPLPCPRGRAGIIIWAVLWLFLAVAPSPPGQPSSGPGGRDYPHRAYSVSRFREGSEGFWVFAPDSPRPSSRAPVVLFLHGWSVVDPMGYMAWIEHLARRGNIVIYPRYQESPLEFRGDMFWNAVGAFREGLEVLPGMGLEPDTSRFAVVGHSLGGIYAVALAGIADSLGLPRPKALMLLQTGGKPIPEFQPHRIPSATLLLAVAGDRDDKVGDSLSREIVLQAVQVPDSDKDFLLMASDDHGRPPLIADHTSALASPSGRAGCLPQAFSHFFGASGFSTDALDWFGYWKLFDGLTDAAFYGTHRKFALGGGPEQLWMGTWSDGVPVNQPKRPLAGDNPLENPQN